MKKDVLMAWGSEIIRELFSDRFIADTNLAELFQYKNKQVLGEHYDNWDERKPTASSNLCKWL